MEEILNVAIAQKAVQAVEGYDLEEFGLVLGGQKLDSDRRISDYGLQNESSLTLDNTGIEEVVYECLDINGVVLTEIPLPKPLQEGPICAMCPDEPELAAFYCLLCPELALCLGCKDKHIVRMKGHYAVTLEEWTVQKDVMCMKHPKKRLEICCITPCQEIICAICVLDHQGHQFRSLSEAADRERAELQRNADEAMSKISVSVIEATAVLDALIAHVTGLHGLVAVEGEKLIQLIRQKIAAADAAIDTKVAPELERLNKAKDVSRNMAGKMRSCAAVAERLRDPKKCSDVEVFQLSPLLRQAFEAILLRGQPKAEHASAADGRHNSSEHSPATIADSVAPPPAAAAAPGTAAAVLRQESADAFVAAASRPLISLTAAAAMAKEAENLFAVEDESDVQKLRVEEELFQSMQKQQADETLIERCAAAKVICSEDGIQTLGLASELGIANCSFTFMAWVKINEFNRTGNCDNTLLGQIVPADHHKRNCLHLTIRRMRPYFGFFGNDTAGSVELMPDIWYHLAFVYDKDKGGGNQSMYLNGDIDRSQDDRPPFEGGSTPIMMGSWERTGRNLLNGSISAPRLIAGHAVSRDLILMLMGQPPSGGDFLLHLA